MSTPPPAFDPRELAASMVKMAKNPQQAIYPDWSAVVFKNLYGMFPGVIRYASSAALRIIMKRGNEVNTSGNILQPSKDNTGIDGKTLLPAPSKVMKIGTAGILAIGFLSYSLYQKKE